MRLDEILLTGLLPARDSSGAMGNTFVLMQHHLGAIASAIDSQFSRQ
jgi:hypothetical protein